MTTKQIYIKRNTNGKIQYLTEILPQIPTNTILYKKLTGIGATYGELKTKRNSIIIEPNVPVIQGKCKDIEHKDDNLFGVYEGVYEDAVIKYLEKCDKHNKPYKLLCTPESFSKIKNAFIDLDMDIYSSCFLLFDECHKIIKDSDYRSNIIIPFDDFFRFDNKALVSATPINFSDPRFEQNNFQTIEICPIDFEYKKDLMIYPTNNVMEVIKELMSKSDKQMFFFINSTDMILALIQNLKIENESSVFCANKSVKKLKENKYKNAYCDWNINKMSKYNFMTSRFFNALDIKIDEKPDVVIVSDVFFSKYTMIDPFTDSIQIVGRFRNGISSFTHITNTNKNIPVRSKIEIETTLKIFEGVYNIIKKFYKVATTVIIKETLNQILKNLPFASMLDELGNINYFNIDNYKDENIMKGYYNNQHNIVTAYKNTKMFIVKSFIKRYSVNGNYILDLENKPKSIKDKRKIIVSQLEDLKDDNTEMSIEYKRALEKADFFIFNAYNILGKERIEQLDYSCKRIKETIILKQFEEKATGTEFIELINNSFKIGQKYKLNNIKTELKRIFSLLNIQTNEAITAKTLEKYFNVNNTSINGNRAYFIVSSKF